MRNLLIITALLFISLSVVSCSNEPNATDDESRESRGEERMSSGEIVDRYVDTLTTARGKALDSVEAVEESTRAIERAIEEMDATGGDQ
ncbi:MAG: hypothetical protein GY721_07010 [Deltaproteobacteria bacterium]|nr:hypothetical protein [Deltaproteobacteria bacterium]